jgi:hypothetical protein
MEDSTRKKLSNCGRIKAMKWWSTMNDYTWPHDLPGKPPNFDSKPRRAKPGSDGTDRMDCLLPLIRRLETRFGAEYFDCAYSATVKQRQTTWEKM